jgi:hypothetical protein
MPSLRASRIELPPDRYRRIDPVTPEGGFRPSLPPEHPIAIRRSPVMISSLPSIATDVDGATRQFYGGANVPTRRLSLAE